jgi:hypothetical protein
MRNYEGKLKAFMTENVISGEHLTSTTISKVNSSMCNIDCPLKIST